MKIIVLRKRDVWRWVQDRLQDLMPYLGQFEAPGARSQWVIRTMAAREWVELSV